jgi:hypothetical protein
MWREICCNKCSTSIEERQWEWRSEHGDVSDVKKIISKDGKDHEVKQRKDHRT